MTYRHLHFPIIVLSLAFYSLPCRAETEALSEPGLSIIDHVMLLDGQDMTDIELLQTTDFPEPEDTSQAELEDSINQYVDRVLKLEIENGAYNNDLSEALVGLGLSYSASGKYKEALNVYIRALHINRVNEGLQNVKQLPLLQLVIEANTALADYKSLADNYNYLLWVYNRNYDKGDPELVPVLQQVANWNLDAYEVTSPPDSVGHLIIATNLFTRAMKIIESTEGYHSPNLIKPLYGIVSANFKLVEPFGFIENIDFFNSGRVSPLLPTDFNRINSPVDNSNFSRNDYSALGYSQDHLSRILQDQKNAASLIQNSYKSGRNALERIIDIHNKNPDLPKLSHAYAHTHLGDWYIRFYKRASATSNYHQAYQLLTEAGYNTEGEGGFFGHPRSLDTFRSPQIASGIIKPDTMESNDVSGNTGSDKNRFDDELNDAEFVLVQFNVTEYGTVRNLDILKSNPTDNVKFRRMARDKISTTPFRPRMENGKPTMTENVKMLYRFE